MSVNQLSFKKLIAYVLLVLTTFFWGITFVVVKDAIQHVDVFVFLAQRFLISSVLLIAIWPLIRRPLPLATLIRGVILGVMLFGGFAFQTAALNHTTASNTAFLTGLNVVFVPLISALFLKKNIETRVKTGAVLAFIGLYLLCSNSASWMLNKGDILAFICAICIAVHIIFTGRFVKDHDVYWLTTIQLSVIGLLSLGISMVASKPVFVWYPSIRDALIICVLFATVFAFLMQTATQRYISPTSTALIFCLEPVFAAFSSYFLINERLGLRAGIGACLILTGMILAEFQLRARRPSEAPADF